MFRVNCVSQVFNLMREVDPKSYSRDDKDTGDKLTRIVHVEPERIDRAITTNDGP